MSDPITIRPPKWRIEILGNGYQTNMPELHTIFAATDAAKGVKFSITEDFFIGVSSFSVFLPRPPRGGNLLIPSGSLVRFMMPGLEEPGLLSPITRIEEKENAQVLKGEGFRFNLEQVIPADVEKFRESLQSLVAANSLEVWEVTDRILRGFYDFSGNRLFTTFPLIDPPNENPANRHPLKSVTGWKHYPAFESQNVAELLYDVIQMLNRPGFDSDGELVRPVNRWRLWIDGLRRFRIEEVTKNEESIHRLVQQRHFLDIESKEDAETVRNSVTVYHKQTTDGQLTPSWEPLRARNGKMLDPPLFPFPARDILSIERYGEKAARLDFDYALQDQKANPDDFDPPGSDTPKSGAIQGWEIANRVIQVLGNPYEEMKIEMKAENISGWGTHDIYLRNKLQKLTLWKFPRERVPKGFSVPISKEAPGIFTPIIINSDQSGGAYSIRTLKVTKPKEQKPRAQLDFTLPFSLWGIGVFHTKVFLPNPVRSLIFYTFSDDFGNTYRYPLDLYPGEWTDIVIPLRFDLSRGELHVNNGPDYSGPLSANKPPLGILMGDFLVSDDGRIGGILNLNKITLEVETTDKFEILISWGTLDGYFSQIKRLPLKTRLFELAGDIKLTQTFGELIDPDTYLERLKINTKKGETLRRLFTSYGTRAHK